jgi:hypothetical protein
MKIRVTLYLLLIVFMYPISGLTFDKEEVYVSGFFGYSEQVWKSTIVETYTTGAASGYIPDEYSSALVLKDGEFKMSASGIVMKGANRKNYIITAAHAVIPSHVRIDKYYTQVRKVNSRSIMVSGAGEANIMWTDEKMDIVVLTPSNKTSFIYPSLKPSPYLATYTYVSSNANYTLKEGDALATIVGARDKNGNRSGGLEIRRGKILSTDVVRENDLALEFFNKLDVITDINVWPGDSGSPVFAFRKGVPFLVGILRAVIRKTDKSLHASYFVRVDPVVMFLETEPDVIGDWSINRK